MKTLERLKLVALPEKASLPPAQLRRQKFLTKLDEQIAMFKAEQGGQPYQRRKRVWVNASASGDMGLKLQVPAAIVAA